MNPESSSAQSTPSSDLDHPNNSTPPDANNHNANEITRPHSILHLPDLQPWPDPVDGKALLDALKQLLTRFVVLPQWQRFIRG